MSENKIGDQTKTTELLMEQYKMYVQMSDNVSARRGDTNKLYISLLTGILAVVPFVIEKGTSMDIQRIVFAMLGCLGISLCLVWALNIRSYKQLNKLKFKVIHEMEQLLPFACYNREWEILTEDKGNSYLRLSRIEQYIPFLLMIPYVVVLIYSLLR